MNSGGDPSVESAGFSRLGGASGDEFSHVSRLFDRRRERRRLFFDR